MVDIGVAVPIVWCFWARLADSWRWESLACSSAQSFCQWATSYSSRGLREQSQSSEAFEGWSTYPTLAVAAAGAAMTKEQE
jgi:hypothetical protein